MRSEAIQGFVDRLLGRGQAAVTVPPLDGALKPNNLLEQASVAVGAQAPDNIVEWNGQLLFSSGSQVRRIGAAAGDAGAPAPGFDMPGSVTAMASSPTGLLAVASDTGGISIVDRQAGAKRISGPDHPLFNCTTAMTFADDRTLIVCVGSSRHAPQEWPRDLLTGGRSGSLWRIDIRTGEAAAVAGGLAFPNGIALSSDGHYIVSESWQKRLIRIAPNGKVVGQVIEDLPGYPGRLSPSGRGGYWLCVFAPRSQLIEFVLREHTYRRAMMEEVDPRFWIAPALSSGTSVLEPMQGGALKQMGILKPWAPTQSYGLVVELNDSFVPLRSMHSRAGGRRHGVTSAVERQGALWATSKGGDELVRLDLATQVG